jgi:hypothetical protein
MPAAQRAAAPAARGAQCFNDIGLSHYRSPSLMS